MKNYTPLHCHTDYSILDSVMKVEDYVERLEQLEMPYGAVTEHGNLCSSYKFYKEAKKRGIQAIIGCEVYVTPYATIDEIKEAVTKQKKEKQIAVDNGLSHRRIKYYGHLIIHALNDIGYKNLLYLSSISHIKQNKRVGIRVEDLKNYAEGLICFVGGELNPLLFFIIQNKIKKIDDFISTFLDIFTNNFCFEIQRIKNNLINKYESKKYGKTIYS